MSREIEAIRLSNYIVLALSIVIVSELSHCSKGWPRPTRSQRCSGPSRPIASSPSGPPGTAGTPPGDRSPGTVPLVVVALPIRPSPHLLAHSLPNWATTSSPSIMERAMEPCSTSLRECDAPPLDTAAAPRTPPPVPCPAEPHASPRALPWTPRRPPPTLAAPPPCARRCWRMAGTWRGWVQPASCCMQGCLCVGGGVGWGEARFRAGVRHSDCPPPPFSHTHTHTHTHTRTPHPPPPTLPHCTQLSRRSMA